MRSASTGSPGRWRWRSRRGERGFSLLEVIVAFAILAVALAALLPGFSGGLRATGRAGDRVAALLVARSLLDRVGTEIPVRPADLSGEIDGAPWTLRIRPWSTPQPSGGALVALYEIEVSVDDRSRLPLTLTTLRLGPAAAQ